MSPAWAGPAALALLLVACGDDAASPTSAPAATSVAQGTAPVTRALPPATETSRNGAVGPAVLAAGSFELPAASEFGDPGFHETVVIEATVMVPVPGEGRLVVRLRDEGRPDVMCSSEHPLSGCATVDWSDAESRPNVPIGGVFDNRLVVRAASGEYHSFLSESGDLASQPDAFDPG